MVVGKRDHFVMVMTILFFALTGLMGVGSWKLEVGGWGERW
jgi:high-affinity Fe2+/Pb2+ permease